MSVYITVTTPSFSSHLVVDQLNVLADICIKISTDICFEMLAGRLFDVIQPIESGFKMEHKKYYST